jgi:hypothetical protein
MRLAMVVLDLLHLFDNISSITLSFDLLSDCALAARSLAEAANIFGIACNFDVCLHVAISDRMFEVERCLINQGRKDA